MDGGPQHFALSAIGRDRPGIVAAVSATLLNHRLNIEDSRMTILGGHFAMMLIVSAPAGTDVSGLSAELEAVGRRLELEAIALSPVEELETPQPQASHVATVYGRDHPGIVHAVASALAQREIDITDLSTRMAGEEDPPLYGLFMELAIPRPELVDELRAELERVAAEEGVRVSLRELQQDVL